MLVLLGAGQARAQSAAPLPAVPELKLTWPIAPLAYRYSEAEITGYRNGPLQLFRAESLWLKAPGFRLLSYASSERAFELDCSLTCQPVAARVLALEGRILLPKLTSWVSEPHVFVRQSAARTPLSARSLGAVHVGVAGFLNF